MAPRRRWALTPRLIAMLLTPIVVVFVVFGYSTVRLRRRAMAAEADYEVRDHCTTLKVALDGFLRDRRVADMGSLVEGLSRADRVIGVAVFDRNDQLVAVSRAIGSSADSFRSLAHSVRERQQVRASEREIAPFGRVYLYAFPIGAAGSQARGSAVLVRELRYIDDNVARFARELALGCLALVIAVSVTAWLAIRWSVLRPLSVVLGGVEKVGAGRLEPVIEPARDDEMARIARSFNRMVVSLREARIEIDAKNADNLALERRLQHAQRLALIGQLAASLAHQIGSPLNVVLGRARYALKQGGQTERDRRHLEEIVAGGEAISDVVQRLLNQARRVRGQATRIDLVAVARDTLRFVETECARTGIRPAFDGDHDAFVTAVRGEIEQLLLNLCINAIHAQPSGGELRISVHRESNDEGGRVVELTVADSGPGITAEMRDHIFEAFFTTKPESVGTGLGLAICDEIVRRHGGTIVADDREPGRGALFRVRLPEA